MKCKRIVKIGTTITGEKNNICDVPGVKVGHFTLEDGNLNTGITAILPHDGNMFRNKVTAGVFPFNGFGKSIGLMQVEELGTIETPILLTNTLNVGKVSDGLIEYMLKDNLDIGCGAGTINPMVFECNDGSLNAIRERVLGIEEVKKAIEDASDDFYQGVVGAGTGMTCHGLKGGIGSSSRVITIDGSNYVVGVLVNTNFGRSDSYDLIFNGRHIGYDIYKRRKEKLDLEKGSIIVVVATNVPLLDRQLKRVCKRAAMGIARTGSYAGNGSGDVFVGFTTSNIVSHHTDCAIRKIQVLEDSYIDKVFKATVDATEEAILNSMLFSSGKVGYHKTVESINDYKDLFVDLLIKEND